MKPVKEIDKDGYITYKLNGVLHRTDGPALQWKNGEFGVSSWFNNGLLHREDGGPAVEHLNGRLEWHLNGKKHRVNGPAVIFPGGTMFWYINGEYHRDDGPAVILECGEKAWYANGKLHRLNGPAIENDNYKQWFVNGIQYNTEFEYWIAVKNYIDMHQTV